MIISTLNGGLGNQLFQYAIGRKLALRYGCPLKLHTINYRQHNGCDTKRDFLLDCFNISADIASDFDVFQCRLIREGCLQYIPNIFDICMPPVNLIGWWQCENYFKDIRDILLGELTLRVTSNTLKNYIDKLDDNTVSMHIRRGDYVTNTSTNSYHGLCTLDYYNKAIEYFKHADKILVFSDDKEWVKANFNDKKFIIIENLSTVEELTLMSECPNNIIANSTFSWWGSWLNNTDNKIVVAPTRWYNDANANNLENISLKEWIRI
jgi:hypothetical protein